MDFKQLQSFVSVVKYKSFTQAAKQLYISQPTISAHINQLEEELGKRLILRTTKSIELTPIGQEIYSYAINILDMKNRMVSVCQSQAKKIIHVGASTIPSAYILPEILAEFGSKNADTYFSLHQNNSQGIVDGLKEGLFDIGLIGMKVEDETITCIPFFQDHMVLISPVNEHYLNLKQQNTNIEQLLKEPIILREKGSGSKKSVDHFLEQLGILDNDLNNVARINDQEAIKNLVAGGLGISILSEMAARNFIVEKRVLDFSLENYGMHRDLYLIYRKNYIRKSYVQSFIHFLLKKYNES
ncbi:MAG: LysR family transcriptional regulator [Firmicutes bacterium]|nr:LysR family transcriptional regulator [Bacillota bacterium]